MVAAGVGETWWGIPDRERPGAEARAIASVVDDILAPRVVGREAGEIGRLWFELWDYGYRYADQGIYPMALSGLDIALWDLLGKTLGGLGTATAGRIAARRGACLCEPAAAARS